MPQLACVAAGPSRSQAALHRAASPALCAPRRPAVMAGHGIAASVATVALVLLSASGPAAAGWEALGAGVNGEVTAFGDDRVARLLIAGTFSNVDGQASPALAWWNGGGWLPSPWRDASLAAQRLNVTGIAVSSSGAALAVCAYTSGPSNVTQLVVAWTGSEWLSSGEPRLITPFLPSLLTMSRGYATIANTGALFVTEGALRTLGAPYNCQVPCSYSLIQTFSRYPRVAASITWWDLSIITYFGDYASTYCVVEAMALESYGYTLIFTATLGPNTVVHAMAGSPTNDLLLAGRLLNDAGSNCVLAINQAGVRREAACGVPGTARGVAHLGGTRFFVVVDGAVHEWMGGSSWATFAQAAGNAATINLVHVFNTALYVGGSFTSVNGVPAANVVLWRAGPSPTPTVTQTTTPTGTISSSGTATPSSTASHTRTPSSTPSNTRTPSITPSNTPTPSITASATGTLLPWTSGTWLPMGGGANGAVTALTSNGTHLVAGGSFTTVDGIGYRGIAWWDGRQWLPRGYLSYLQFYDYDVRASALHAVGPTLHAAGDFVHSFSYYDYWTELRHHGYLRMDDGQLRAVYQPQWLSYSSIAAIDGILFAVQRDAQAVSRLNTSYSSLWLVAGTPNACHTEWMVAWRGGAAIACRTVASEPPLYRNTHTLLGINATGNVTWEVQLPWGSVTAMHAAPTGELLVAGGMPGEATGSNCVVGVTPALTRREVACGLPGTPSSLVLFRSARLFVAVDAVVLEWYENAWVLSAAARARVGVTAAISVLHEHSGALYAGGSFDTINWMSASYIAMLREDVSPSITPTPSLTPSVTPSGTPTSSLSPSLSRTPSNSPSLTPSPPSRSITPTGSPSTSGTPLPAIAIGQGLVAHYRLDGNAVDATGINGNGTVVGALPVADARGNAMGAMRMNASMYVRVPHSEVLSRIETAGQLTIAFAARCNSSTGFSAVSLEAQLYGAWSLTFTSTFIIAWMASEAWAAMSRVASNRPLDLSTWSHMAFVLDPVTMWWYVNGTLVASVDLRVQASASNAPTCPFSCNSGVYCPWQCYTHTGKPPAMLRSTSGHPPLRLGHTVSGDVDLADFRIYNRSLGQWEVAHLAHLLTQPQLPSPAMASTASASPCASPSASSPPSASPSPAMTLDSVGDASPGEDSRGSSPATTNTTIALSVVGAIVAAAAAAALASRYGHCRRLRVSPAVAPVPVPVPVPAPSLGSTIVASNATAVASAGPAQPQPQPQPSGSAWHVDPDDIHWAHQGSGDSHVAVAAAPAAAAPATAANIPGAVAATASSAAATWLPASSLPPHSTLSDDDGHAGPAPTSAGAGGASV